MNSIKLLRKIFKNNILTLIFAVSVLTLSSFIEASSIISITPLIDLIVNSDVSQYSNITIKIFSFTEFIGLQPTALTMTLFFLFVIIGKNIFAGFSKYINTKIHFRLVKEVVVEIFSSFLSSNLIFFINHNTGVLGNTLLKENEKIGLAFEATAEIISNFLKIVFYIAITFFISGELTLIVIVFIGLAVYPFSLLGKITYKAGKIHTAQGNKFQEIILETFNGIKLILGYGNQHKSMSNLNKCFTPYINSGIKFVLVRSFTPLAFEPLGVIIILASVYLGKYEFNLEISELFIILYSFRLSAHLSVQMINKKNSFQHFIPSLNQIYTLKTEAEKLVQYSGTKKFKKMIKGIHLKNVSFAYDKKEQVLKNVNLTINRGKMTALVGKSGGGKTTLIDIIMGFYPIDEGDVLLDDLSLVEYDMISWRKKIGFVPQDPFLFNLSIKENLIWGNENASENDIFQACESANANEFIERLPNKLETIVGNRGIRLSGGQRQRLALARAILRTPEILILDEATSSLDSQSEQLIQKSIENISKETTILIIAHRLSTIRKSDYIYLLDDGGIVEEGTFEHLMLIHDGKFIKSAELQGIRE